ncbi:diguanylate cyclase (GGDEF) domain-containing protein [Methylobacterium phyllostachyos]|uniref:Diguanylate cyclase (GGDEF) domain-containing protein n=1 Tax=Methylobacterium phyllostachyos TaxID=582672 RepID=A0A1H0A7D3_9HYPH|nr:EAL domain-containing protein [Methylobacterium phyllostachyos]SDN29569.1 diguanylate cyclase (GGDEF) domain-containing protein [Methylobacterium phyllostachyos]
MYRAFACLTEAHTTWVVVLAACVCWITCSVALKLEQRVRTGSDRRRLVWPLAAGFSIGSGIWSTHFIGMLGYDPGVVLGYEPRTTLLSLVVAIAAASVAFLFARSAPSSGWTGAAAGLILGLGIACMHFLGIAGVRLPGSFTWNIPLAGAAIGAGGLLAAAGMALHVRSTDSHGTDGRSRAVAATVLTLAIAVLHFLAMAAAQVVPDPTLSVPQLGLDRGVLAGGIAVVMAVILAFGALTLMLDRLHGMNVALAQQGRMLREKTLLLDTTLDSMDQGLIKVDAGGVVRVCNERALALLDLPRAMMQAQPSYRAVLRYQARHRERNRTDRAFRAWVARGEAGRAHVYERARPNGLVLEVRTVPLAEGGFVRTFTDITKRKAAEAEVARLARHDVLTGLPNRALFHETVARSLADIAQRGGACAVLYLDLDGFKSVNDSLGHQAGDELLRHVAGGLVGVAGAGAVARLGGDEFAVLGPGGTAAAGALAERLIALFDTPLSVGEHRIAVGLSVGIALAPEHGTMAECLYRRADLALYRAKAEGRGTFRIFTPAMDEEAEARRVLERDLRQAMDDGGLSLHYQPQVEGRTGVLVGFEALLRWVHPVRGTIGPDIFVPLAEETGLIVALGEWVLRAACREAAGWAQPLKVAVNLSPRQFQRPDLPDRILAILAQTGLSPDRLELEVTESIIINDMARAVGILRRLRSYGIRISMDDFGTGYASLATLQAFPFDKLKIDRSFVAQLGSEPQAAVIVRAVLGLGRSLGMGVVAEGVETQAQRDFLAEEACGEMQGYLFGKPRPIADYAAALEHPADVAARAAGPRLALAG